MMPFPRCPRRALDSATRQVAAFDIELGANMNSDGFETDGTGKQYLEVATAGGEAVRITRVPPGGVKYTAESVLRMQVREASGRLRMPGVDVPAGALEAFVAALARFSTE